MWAAAPVDAKQPHRGRLRPSGFDLESTAEAIRSIDGELCALGESAPKAACDSPSSSVPPVGALGTAERSALAFQKQIGALKRSGDVTAIMQGFHAHSAHVGVAKAASKALFSLSSSSDEHDERIIGAGGAEQVVEAMRTHERDKDVQEHACRLLKNLCALEDGKAAVERAGGANTVLAALRAHPQHHGVQEHGLSALMNLVANSVANKQTVAREGGVASTLAAMRAHPKRAEIQRLACGLLMSLTYNNHDIKTLVASEGGVEAILVAMTAHQHHLGLQEMGCGALDNVAWSDPALQARVRDAGAVDVVEAAIADHFLGATANCKRYAEHLLATLCQSSDSS